MSADQGYKAMHGLFRGVLYLIPRQGPAPTHRYPVRSAELRHRSVVSHQVPPLDVWRVAAVQPAGLRDVYVQYIQT